MLAIALLAAASCAVPVAQDFWAPAGHPQLIDGHGLCNQILLKEGSKPFIAFQDGTTTKGGATVLRLVGPSWLPVGEPGKASRGRAWYNRMALDGQGGLYCVSRDYGLDGKAGVRRFDEGLGAWQDVGEAATPDEAHFTDIAISPLTDEPWIVFADRSTTPVDRIRVRRFTQGAWEYVGAAPLSVGEGRYCTIAFGPAGAPHVALSDVGLGQALSVFRWNGTSWAPVGPPGFTGQQSVCPQIAFDPAGELHVAWMLHHFDVFVEAFQGGQWNRLGGGAALPGQVPDLDSEIWRLWLPFDFDSQGRPTVAYQSRDEGARLMVRRLEVNGWQTLGGDFATAGRSDYPALAIGSDDQAWILYRDGVIGSPPSAGRLVQDPTTYCPSAKTQDGCQPDTVASGNASLGGGFLRLDVTRVTPGGIGVLVVGTSTDFQPLPSGLLCVGAPALRLHPQGTGSSPTPCGGTLSHTFTPAELSALLGGVPGSVFAQWWFRGPNASSQTSSWLASAMAFSVAP